MLINSHAKLSATVIFLGFGLFGPAHAAGGVEWGYHGDLGPGAWGSLKDSHGKLAYPICGLGRAQSPIDISSPAAASGQPAPIAFSYKATPLKVKNNGHTIQVDYAAGSTMTVGGATYDLVQFHFHGPSEHTVKGAPFPMEGHLVHARKSGGKVELAVVGVLMREGNSQGTVQTVWDKMPTSVGDVTVPEQTVNAADLLPAGKSYFAYDGSLTTPPCSEGVKWHVLSEAIEVSSQQVKRFKALFDGNARPVQPLNGRGVALQTVK